MDKNEHELDGYIDLIQRNAVEMNRAINKLNSVHQINKRSIRTTRVDLSALIVDVKQRLSKYIDVQPVNIRVVIGKEIVFYGESLGSGVAVQTAAALPPAEQPAALILEAPFTSIADVAAEHYPFMPARMLVKDRFDSRARIGDYEGAMLILHGENDRVVPIAFGRALFAAAREPKEAQWFADRGHNDLFDEQAARGILDFLGRF